MKNCHYCAFTHQTDCKIGRFSYWHYQTAQLCNLYWLTILVQSCFQFARLPDYQIGFVRLSDCQYPMFTHQTVEIFIFIVCLYLFCHPIIRLSECQITRLIMPDFQVVRLYVLCAHMPIRCDRFLAYLYQIVRLFMPDWQNVRLEDCQIVSTVCSHTKQHIYLNFTVCLDLFCQVV